MNLHSKFNPFLHYSTCFNRLIIIVWNQNRILICMFIFILIWTEWILLIERIIYKYIHFVIFICYSHRFHHLYFIFVKYFLILFNFLTFNQLPCIFWYSQVLLSFEVRIKRILLFYILLFILCIHFFHFFKIKKEKAKTQAYKSENPYANCINNYSIFSFISLISGNIIFGLKINYIRLYDLKYKNSDALH